MPGTRISRPAARAAAQRAAVTQTAARAAQPRAWDRAPLAVEPARPWTPSDQQAAWLDALDLTALEILTLLELGGMTEAELAEQQLARRFPGDYSRSDLSAAIDVIEQVAFNC